MPNFESARSRARCLNRLVSVVAAAVAALMSTVSVFAQADEDARLEVFFKSYLEKHFQQQPLDATRLGDHRFDSLLDDISAEARKGWLTFARQTLKQLPKAV